MQRMSKAEVGVTSPTIDIVRCLTSAPCCSSMRLRRSLAQNDAGVALLTAFALTVAESSVRTSDHIDGARGRCIERISLAADGMQTLTQRLVDGARVVQALLLPLRALLVELTSPRPLTFPQLSFNAPVDVSLLAAQKCAQVCAISIPHYGACF